MEAIQPRHDKTTLEQLEFPRILEKLASHLSTSYGSDQLKQLEPDVQVETVRRRLEEVREMMALLQSGEVIPLGGLSDIRPLLQKTRPAEAYLEGEELLEIQHHLQMMGEIHLFFRKHQEAAPGLYFYARGIHGHKNIVSEIQRTVDSSGEVVDHASPELRDIRRQIRHLESEQKRVLQQMLKKYAEYSQDEIVTLRDGRMVLGIQQQWVSRVNGIVHGTSASGATVFIEPMETLQISNRIQSLRIEERKEVIKILRFLTDLIRQVRDDIYYGIENIGYLDVLLAKARLALELKAEIPRVREDGPIRLKNARHPLLILKMGHQHVVPLSVTLGEDFVTLVITGPNAGGKTVSIKTIGLLMLMVQYGMPIPAEADSEIPLLPQILVDIGDRQSIEQDLSTFSAHVVRMREILERADARTLVLIDEIGTGTDPREGAALAISILQYLTRRKVFTIATTHHGELKAFAHQEAGVENASMEFDLETLQPTYRLRVGVPGSSYAFEIARRYGLPDWIIQRAREVVGQEKDQLEKLVLELEKRIQQLEKQQLELSIRLTEAEGLRQLYQNQVETLKREKAALRQKAAREAAELVQQARATIEKLVQEIRQTQAEKSRIKMARQTLEQLQAEMETIATGEPETGESPPMDLRPGDRVWIESLREEGEVLTPVDDKGKVRVQVGHVKLNIEVHQLRRLERPAEAPRTFQRAATLKAGMSQPAVKPELDVRGMDAIEAVEATDHYLTQAINAGWDEVRIIHGKGTGVLRQRINEFLARDRRVLEKRLGRWGEGDTGVTIVKLKK
ncbi:MAG: endonuclease MutS2 [Calditrichaeota bacterium]|nr:endonuclease MutS2 [Calditrichota bacterium]